MLPTCYYLISEVLVVTLYNTRFKYEFYILSTQCIYTFQNQQRLLPYTALTYWFCNWDGVFTAPYRLGLSIKQTVLFLNINALVSSPWSLRMCWNVKSFHCWKAASWATLTSLNISFCLLGCLHWLHLVNIAWGFSTCFFLWRCGHQPHATTPYPEGPWYPPLSASFIEFSLAWMILPTIGLLQAQFWVHWCKQACHLAKICIPKDRGTIMVVSFLSS